MEAAEFKQISVLGWLALWFLSQGKLRACLAHLQCAALRALENGVALFLPRRVCCRLCGWEGPWFFSFAAGRWVRRRALCPRCGSLERHRLLLGAFQSLRPTLPARLRLLDIAPNPGFTLYCSRDPSIEYLSVDLVSPLAMRHMDIQQMDFPDASFDVVVCVHVLDYVRDDRKAIREIRRVLASGGIAVIQEGFDPDRPTAEWGAPREEELGRVRSYGHDLRDRLEHTGFRVEAAPGTTDARARGTIYFAR